MFNVVAVLRSQRQGNLHWRTVVHKVQIRDLEVHNTLSIRPLNVRVPHSPFFGIGPIKNGRSRGHFRELDLCEYHRLFRWC